MCGLLLLSRRAGAVHTCSTPAQLRRASRCCKPGAHLPPGRQRAGLGARPGAGAADLVPDAAVNGADVQVPALPPPAAADRGAAAGGGRRCALAAAGLNVYPQAPALLCQDLRSELRS